MYHHTWIKNFWVLPAESIYIFSMDFRINKRLFPRIALADLFLQPRWSVFAARYELNLNAIQVIVNKATKNVMQNNQFA
jgi:hypothetical protein